MHLLKLRDRNSSANVIATRSNDNTSQGDAQPFLSRRLSVLDTSVFCEVNDWS